jgi:hypothetical protein
MQPEIPKTFEQQVLERLDRIDADISGLKTELTQTQKWQDRTWDVIKWVGGISSALAISAAIALVGLVF